MIDSGGESDVDSILNDSEFLSDTPTSKMVDDTHDNLVLKAIAHVASEQTDLQQEDFEELQKKRKCQLIYDIKWRSASSAQRLHSTGSCLT